MTSLDSISCSEQKGACGLEALARSHLPAPRQPLKLSHRSLHRCNKDERTVTTACLKPGPRNGLQRPTDFKGQTRAQLILARRTDLHLKAVYICADLSLDQTSPCSPAADHTFRGTSMHACCGRCQITHNNRSGRGEQIQRAMSVGHPLEACFHGRQVYASFPFENIEGVAKGVVWDRLCNFRRELLACESLKDEPYAAGYAKDPFIFPAFEQRKIEPC